jgi:hypothetical protein
MKEGEFMRNQTNQKNVEREKIAAIGTLFAASIVIMLLGSGISLYSLANSISFPVLNTEVPGVLFGLPVIYLGFRYFLAVRGLKTKVYKASSQFSWNNFKKEKEVI